MLLNVDPGKATNRTVFTLVGTPEQVIEAAYRAIKTASVLIDMTKHTGEHPRMGATDVCPLIPVSGITVEETLKYAERLAKRVGEELSIPVYLYEYSARNASRKNLATIREGEYEGFSKKIQLSEWKPDYGPSDLNVKSGATVIGVRDFLVAYNINLNTKSTRIANAIAFDVREQGRIKRIGHPVTGEVVVDEAGQPIRIPGTLKSVKAIGWYIEEYDTAQISMNLTDIHQTSLHEAFEEVVKKADERGIRVTGSEIVGMVPKSVLVDAGKYFLKKQKRSLGISEKEIIALAIRSLGLNEIQTFKPEERIIEYMTEDTGLNKLRSLDLDAFADLTASENPAPGGGSIAAYVGTLGAALGAMVANLSANKRGWEDKLDYFSASAESLYIIKDRLIRLVDEDTQAFDQVMVAFALPKNTDAEKTSRKDAIELANIHATDIPLETMKTAFSAFPLLKEMVVEGNQNSVTDAGVGALCALTAIEAAYYNVLINISGLTGEQIKSKYKSEADKILEEAKVFSSDIKTLVLKVILKS